MNLLLLQSNQINGQQAVVTGRQLEHLRLVHQQTDGAKIRVGEINGLMGSAIIESIDDHQAVLNLTLNSNPPAPLPLTLVMAMPRPKMLRRCLQTVSSMGGQDNLYNQLVSSGKKLLANAFSRKAGHRKPTYSWLRAVARYNFADCDSEKTV